MTDPAEPNGRQVQQIETALLVTVPALPAAVAEARLRLDPASALGIPEHVTILYPFVPPGGIDDGILNRLASLCSKRPAFGFELVDVQWFGDEVVWLAPDPAEPFRALTLAVAAEFGTPPYSGAYDEVTPHLTLGYRAPVEAMRQAADLVRPLLPLPCRASEVALFAGGPGGWRRARNFKLSVRGGQ